jgi:hypothetical protein
MGMGITFVLPGSCETTSDSQWMAIVYCAERKRRLNFQRQEMRVGASTMEG